MPIKYEVCSGRDYESGGEKKISWTKHGAVFEKDGKFYLKLESFPAPGPDGWFFSLFTPKSKSEKRRPEPARDDGPDDPIPF